MNLLKHTSFVNTVTDPGNTDTYFCFFSTLSILFKKVREVAMDKSLRTKCKCNVKIPNQPSSLRPWHRWIMSLYHYNGLRLYIELKSIYRTLLKQPTPINSEAMVKKQTPAEGSIARVLRVLTGYRCLCRQFRLNSHTNCHEHCVKFCHITCLTDSLFHCYCFSIVYDLACFFALSFVLPLWMVAWFHWLFWILTLACFTIVFVD